MKPVSAWGGRESVGWWMASTGYIYIPVIFGRWQRDQITDTICLTPIGDSHCSARGPSLSTHKTYANGIGPFMPFIASNHHLCDRARLWRLKHQNASVVVQIRGM